MFTRKNRKHKNSDVALKNVKEVHVKIVRRVMELDENQRQEVMDCIDKLLSAKGVG